MLYLITGEWIEDPTVSLQEYATLWDQMICPSLETLSNTAKGKSHHLSSYLAIVMAFALVFSYYS